MIRSMPGIERSSECGTDEAHGEDAVSEPVAPVGHASGECAVATRRTALLSG